jgi:hypothetical protein
MFAPLQSVFARMDSCSFPGLTELNALLDEYVPRIAVQSGLPLRFVPQEQRRRPFVAQYEPRCYLKGEVQTRENNWHDLFNALVWMTFPKAKAIINARHYQAMVKAQNNETGSRGGGRDMLTLLDESGVLVVCADEELAGLLKEFKWKELFWQRREQVEANMGFYLFGHSLFEKALQPYIGLTGHGLLLSVTKDFFSWSLERRLTHLDERLAEYLAASENCAGSRELTPVPLLGIPDWAEGNNKPGFYDNSRYFRSRRISSAGISR